jgi:hypothetical protein
MRRWLATLFIAGYLSALGMGIAAHALGVGIASHPGMYFIVWDMFCGWSAYSQMGHVVAEGESGKFYELAPGPWGEIRPYGSLGRRHYDPQFNFLHKIARNTLKHSQHEPITRVFVVEETYPKKFELPDSIWMARYGVPKDIKRYYRLRSELDSTGMVVRVYDGWFEHQGMLSVMDNPRLSQEARNSQPFFVVDQYRSQNNDYFSGGPTRSASPVGAPLGN